MKIYQKEIAGRLEIKPRNRIVIIKNGVQTFNPSDEMVMEDGWIEFVQPEREEEIVVNDVLSQPEESSEVVKAREALATSDYKVIKCMEAYLSGYPFPYDIHELIHEREEYRRIINKFEDSGL